MGVVRYVICCNIFRLSLQLCHYYITSWKMFQRDTYCFWITSTDGEAGIDISGDLCKQQVLCYHGALYGKIFINHSFVYVGSLPCDIEAVLYYFSRSSVKFQGHAGRKIADFATNWAFPHCNSSLNSPMIWTMHKTWSIIGDVPYCFSRSYFKFQGHTRQTIAYLYHNFALPDCNPRDDSLMDIKWCTKLEVAQKW